MRRFDFDHSGATVDQQRVDEAGDGRLEPWLVADPAVLGGIGRHVQIAHRRRHDDPTAQERYAEAVAADLGWHPEVGRFHLFEVDVEHVSHVRYDDRTGDQSVTTWPPGAEYVRRGTGATSVGAREPFRDLLV